MGVNLGSMCDWVHCVKFSDNHKSNYVGGKVFLDIKTKYLLSTLENGAFLQIRSPVFTQLNVIEKNWHSFNLISTKPRTSFL